LGADVDGNTVLPRDALMVTSLRCREELKDRFEAEVLPLRPRLYGAAVRLTGNPTDAEDLLQETYLRAYRGFSGFQPGTNLIGWLFRILRNTFFNTYRKRLLEPRTVPEDSWYQSGKGFRPTVEASAESIVIDAIPAQRLQEALTALPERYRRVVLLFDVEGFSYKEIAGIVDVPLGTVMSRLHRGRKSLREQLRPPEPSPANLEALDGVRQAQHA